MKFEYPEVKVQIFAVEDVITTSTVQDPDALPRD
jgi:hypothetical protein